MAIRPGFQIVYVLAPAVLLQAPGAFGAEVVFSGSLERVTPGFISVLLADSRLIHAVLPKKGDLSAAAIAAHYNLGDQVQMGCKAISTVYDRAAALHLHLGLKSLRALRPASPQELAQVVALLSWQRGENLLKQPEAPAAAIQAGELERVRQANLEYAWKLPNFVADETAIRYSSDIDAQQWQREDTIESEIAVKGAQLTRQRIRRNGAPWDRPFEDIGGMLWGAFGRELKPVFDPACPTKIEFAGDEAVDGRQFLLFRFSSPANGCFASYPLRHVERPNKSPYNPSRTGRVLVNPERGNVVRYEEEASGFPEDFFADRRLIWEAWDYVKIGEVSYLVPVTAEFVSCRAEGITRRVTVQYRNHRHFESSTNITFGTDRVDR